MVEEGVFFGCRAKREREREEEGKRGKGRFNGLSFPSCLQKASVMSR